MNYKLSTKKNDTKVLITGASSGLGKLTVKTLLEKGHQLASAMRNVGGRSGDYIR